jgi:hypothetical protein
MSRFPDRFPDPFSGSGLSRFPDSFSEGRMSGPQEPKTIEAQQFIVRDGNGKVRATLGAVNAWSKTVLSLHDEEGVPRTYLELEAGGYPSLSFLRADGNPWFIVRRTNNGRTVLKLTRDNARPGLTIVVPDDGDVKVGLGKSNGEEVMLQGEIELEDFGT